MKCRIFHNARNRCRFLRRLLEKERQPVKGVIGNRLFNRASLVPGEKENAPRPFTAPPWSRATATNPTLTTRRILLVEDHDATRNSLAGLLIRRGHQVVPAASLATALALAKTQRFDLVISDIGLPDGCDLMIKLNEQYALKGIAMTGYGMEDDITRTQASGFVAHLTKPISIQSLESAISSIGLPKE